MGYQYVIYEKKEHIAYVTINRPEVMNALHHDANVELSQVFNDFKQMTQPGWPSSPGLARRHSQPGMI